MVPYPEQKADLEYRTYVNALASGLTKAGLPETNMSNAKYAVLMNYSIDKGKSEISSSPSLAKLAPPHQTPTGK